jgi:hypothetical protein
VSAGRGYSWVGERVELNDPFDCPDPYALQGDYLEVAFGVSTVFGGELSFVWLGTARSSIVDASMLVGFALDASVAYGTSEVTGKYRTPCGKCE